MAGAILTAPSTTLSTNTEWQRELAYTEGARYGYDGVSLTEWASGNTNKPSIAAGSTLEIDGAMCEYASDTTLTDSTSPALADGWCYIKHVVSGATVTPTLTNTFGTWDTAKQGYYDGSGNRYSLFAMYRSGAVTKAFTQKHIQSFDNVYDDNEDGIYIDKSSPLYAGYKITYICFPATFTATGRADITSIAPYNYQQIISVTGTLGFGTTTYYGVNRWLGSSVINIRAYFEDASGSPTGTIGQTVPLLVGLLA